MNATQEFDDCQRLAQEKSVPLKQVMAAAEAAYYQEHKKTEKTAGAGRKVAAEVITTDLANLWPHREPK
jgi:antitoxin component of RelBE/YafQ-DinJ toxin-antitoxin module